MPQNVRAEELTCSQPQYTSYSHSSQQPPFLSRLETQVHQLARGVINPIYDQLADVQLPHMVTDHQSQQQQVRVLIYIL